MKNYGEVLDYLYQQLPMYQRVGKIAYKKDLTNILALCERIGNPQHSFPSIHIAGTNGKGSTSHLIAAMLQAHSLKVGLYTSPHYFDFRERIKVNGQEIPEEAVVAFFNDYQFDFEKIKPSFFEWTVALAFHYFALERVDVAVIETGMGGRLDSTNILQPLISVITNVDMDHMEHLGDTKEKIAFEKAGIIKKNTPVVLGERDTDYLHVIQQKAQENASKLVLAEDVCDVRDASSGLSTTEYSISIGDDKFTQLCDLAGGYQSLNIRLALASMITLKDTTEDFSIDIEKCILSLKNVREQTHMLGRWQLLKEYPPIVLDGAHNLHAIRKVIDEFMTIDAERRHIVVGFSNDKDLNEVFNILPRHAVYYFCKADVPRGMEVANILKTTQQLELKGDAYATVASAFDAALKSATEFDAILVTGSIFVVGEVLSHVKNDSHE